jgi:large subunit ribosomal protein L16
MLLPKKVKFRKWHVMRVNPDKKRVETRGTTLAYGSYGLKAMTSARVLATQIESARKAMSKELKKAGKVWIRIFPDMPFVGRSGEVGMGKGKGDPQGYMFIVKPGRILFEIDGVDEIVAKRTLLLGADKLPNKTKIVSRHV